MGIVAKARLMVPSALSEAPPLMVEQRARVMKAVSDIIKEKSELVIGNEMDYKTKIAGPSSAGYAPVMDGTFVSKSDLTRDEIVRKQAFKAMNSYQKYLASVSHMFEDVNGEVNKRFREAVDAKNEVYSMQMGQVLAFTGAVAELGKGLVGLVVSFITGDKTVLRHLRGDDEILAGGPLNVAVSKAALKAALAQRLIQSGIILVQADWDSTVITAENDKNNAIIAGLQSATYSPFATAGVSHCDWVTIDGRKYMEVQISTP
ncbi:MAG: hypothetical protein V1701_10150 [Planctomycetota bacterium]